MATTPAKPPTTNPPTHSPASSPRTTARAPDQQIPAGQRAPDHPLPAGYSTGYTDKPTRTKEEIQADRERRNQTGESVPLSELNLDPMNDVSRNPRYNPELDPPLSSDDALAAMASTLQAHHIDTKAYKQQFADENRPDGVIQRIAIPGTPPPDQLEPVDELEPEVLHENTRAEMEAGRAALAAYAGRGAAEHEAGRKAVEQRKLTHTE